MMPVVFEFTTRKSLPKLRSMIIRTAKNGFSVTVDWESPEGGILKSDEFIFQDAKRLSQFIYGMVERTSKGDFDPMNYDPEDLFDNSDEVEVTETEEKEVEDVSNTKGKRTKK